MSKKKKKENKNINITIMVIYLIGVLYLLYFSISYLCPIKSLALYSQKTSGFILVLGFIPLLIINIIAYLRFKKRVILFIPSILCLLLACHYILFYNKKKIEDRKPVETMKCELNGNVYYYSIYLEENQEYSLTLDMEDSLPTSEIDYSTKENIIDYIENYYKNNGGSCP